LKTNKYITTSIAIELLELKSKSWIREILNRMTKEGLLIAKGANKNRRYQLKK